MGNNVSTKHSEPFSDQEIKSHLEEWLAISLATGPSCFSKAEAAAKAAYLQAGLAEPSFIRTDSPLAASKAAIDLIKQGSKAVYDQVHAQVHAQVSDQVYAQVYSQVHAQVYDQVSDQVRDQVYRQVYDQVYRQVYNQVYRQVYDQVHVQVFNQVYRQVHRQVHNQVHQIAQLAQLTIFKDIPEISKLDSLVELAKSTGIYFLLDKTVIFSERPSRIILKGEANERKAILIEYPDGFTITALSPLEQLAIS